MHFNNILKNTTTFEKLGLFLWLLAFVLIFAKVILEPGSHSVVDSYLLGGQRWADRITLYSGPGGFIYTPLFAVLFTPLLHIPEAMTDLIWRLFIIILYLYALTNLINMINNRSPGTLIKWLGMMSIIAVPIAFSGFRNGQMNVILTSVMVLVICQIAEKTLEQRRASTGTGHEPETDLYCLFSAGNNIVSAFMVQGSATDAVVSGTAHAVWRLAIRLATIHQFCGHGAIGHALRCPQPEFCLPVQCISGIWPLYLRSLAASD